MTLKQLKKIIDTNFKPPFMPKGVVTATWVGRKSGKSLLLTIGPREVEFDEDGKVGDTGTWLG
jgi:hypothetical protein